MDSAVHPTAAHPILIVGAGPVGLSLALGLLKRGLAVLVFERRPTLADDPRATTLQPPTLEMLDELGVLEQVLAQGRRVDTLEYWEWDARKRLTSLPLAWLEKHTRTPYRVHLSQPDLCQILYDAIERIQPGTVHLGTLMTSFTDQGETVDVALRKGSNAFKTRGSWLVAADGSRSGVREQLRIPMRPTGKPHIFFTCEVAVDSEPDLGDAAYLFTRSGWALWMRMRDTARLLFLIPPGERSTSDENLEAIRAVLFGADSTVRLHNRASYRVQQQAARNWREGRVILVGDAAHLTFPISGTAMNGGIHDGFTLSQVLESAGDIDAWAASRQTAITNRVAANADATYQALQAKGIFSSFTRSRYLGKLNRQAPGTQHLLRCSMLEDRAESAPELES